MVKCLPEFEYFYSVFLKNRNFIPKIKRSKVTDNEALIDMLIWFHMVSITHLLLLFGCYNIHMFCFGNISFQK